MKQKLNNTGTSQKHQWMELCKIKIFHTEKKIPAVKTVHKIGENLGQLCFREGAIFQNLQGTAENKYQANETASEQMGCLDEQCLKKYKNSQ